MAKKSKPIMGRPLKEIEKKEFEALCGMFCTIIEIADFFECDEDTIQRWCQRTYGETFAGVFKRKSSKGKRSLRRAQYDKAVNQGNVPMLIWMGKQQLGQRDHFLTEEIGDTPRRLIISMDGLDYSNE